LKHYKRKMETAVGQLPVRQQVRGRKLTIRTGFSVAYEEFCPTKIASGEGRTWAGMTPLD